jgi:hydrogenase maturation protein HypF
VIAFVRSGDPHDRRYRYPFTNCTACGPRYSIIESVPYDRERTVMKRFKLCAQCREDTNLPTAVDFMPNPSPAPPAALNSPSKLPTVLFSEPATKPWSWRSEALRNGRIVAVKGLGGYQLLVRADQDPAVERLRTRKRREAKPLALMCPSLEAACSLVRISDEERRLLGSSAGPIVLLERLPTSVSAGGAIRGSREPLAGCHATHHSACTTCCSPT